jgi:hypothetical protein
VIVGLFICGFEYSGPMGFCELKTSASLQKMLKGRLLRQLIDRVVGYL